LPITTPGTSKGDCQDKRRPFPPVHPKMTEGSNGADWPRMALPEKGAVCGYPRIPTAPERTNVPCARGSYFREAADSSEHGMVIEVLCPKYRVRTQNRRS
jgi:hypothetical protein